MPLLLRKNEKSKMELDFLSKGQMNKDMDALLQHYKADKSQASLDKTRRILKRFGSVTDELAAMRDENR